MARLHEHQGKALLAERGLAVPTGRACSTPDQARAEAERIGGRVAVKIQAWTTGRAGVGGVAFADSLDEAEQAARRLLAMTVGAFPVEQVLVEEAIPIRNELFVSLTIDDRARRPALLVSFTGGSGVEQRAEQTQRLAVSAHGEVDADRLRAVLADSPIDPSAREQVARAIEIVAKTARELDARSVEINPLAITEDGRVVAADCRMTIDDYAVFRHPELGIEIARELDHPPTELERIAYRIEQADHRGTFFFAQLPVPQDRRGRAIGFHGAGGGGSMMSMDAASQAGFAPANFTDTSGNPSPAKVYAAARIILAQPNLVGYFGSGSGVASQEQHNQAYGLAKAFLELGLSVPALVRLGGNSESRAVEILEDACRNLPAAVEGYKKDDTPAFIGERFRQLVDEAAGAVWTHRPRAVPDFVGSAEAFSFPVRFGENWEGRVWIDRAHCSADATRAAVENSAGVLQPENGTPVLAISEEDAMEKDSEMIACEIECRRTGFPVIFVDIPIAGLDESVA